ncbi:hypothetical protein MACH09_00950 [Vibrio sp. MACH09]|uniref:hypothetical protein n=1 Tax=Vibrio sp. MACH09 TaxID=3025122 RepID=UPI00278DFD99|nr:hypothetical protein [Vibrio sp. MACH09]GLO59587.1 hypothetical protein MACH09_00950 [Vibrio sp. MACH09]
MSNVYVEFLEKKGLCNVNNIRNLKFYLSYLCHHLDEIKVSRQGDGKADLQKKIYYTYQDPTFNLDPHINLMNESATRSLLSNNAFDWIDKSEDRVNYFVWSMLRLATYDEVTSSNHKFGFTFDIERCIENLEESDKNLYIDLGLDTYPLCRKDVRETIYEFFDVWEAHASAKERFMKRLKRQWISLTNRISPDYSWISPSSKKQNLWIYNYIYKSKIYVPHIPQPTSTKEHYNANIAIIDSYLSLDRDTRRDDYLPPHKIMSRMKKAWQQHEHREKQLKQRKS